MADELGREILCLNCAKSGGHRRYLRGLCWRCYANLDVRNRYPLIKQRYNYRGSSTDNRKRCPLDRTPTSALPGSEEKILVMEKRAASGVAVLHPLDAKPDED